MTDCYQLADMRVVPCQSWHLRVIIFAIIGYSFTAQGVLIDVSFAIAEADRLAGKAGVEATFTFMTPAVYSTLTLNYPAGFFATSPTPTARASIPNQIVPQTPGNSSIVMDVLGLMTPSVAAVTVTLVGCTLGVARDASDSVTVQTFVFTSSPPVSCGGILSAATFISITITSNGAGSVLGPASSPVIVFSPRISIPIGGQVILTMPAGYFTGTIAVVTGGVTGLTATASCSSVAITVTTGGAMSGIGTAISLTLTGLTLSTSAVPAGVFQLHTSVETARQQKIAPAILKAPAFTSLYWNTVTMKSGDDVAPVIVFSAVENHATGSQITLRMPSGYFLGTATLKASVASLTATATTATAATTDIVLTTSGTAIESAAITMTLSGLTLGGAQAAGIYRLSTSRRPGFQQLPAPSIEPGAVPAAADSRNSFASIPFVSATLILSFTIFVVCIVV
jgi:hypothetical protein